MTSEFALIDSIRKALRCRSAGVVRWIGDDAAVAAPGGDLVVTSIDSFVDGVHFRRGEITPGNIGHRALAATLSDLAAMGASTGTAFVSLGLPGGMGEDEVLEIIAGIEEVAAATQTTVCGGDLTAAPALFLSICANGHADAATGTVGRDGAVAGDLIGVTGVLGGARAGLDLLETRDRHAHDVANSPISGELRDKLVERYARPWPRLTEGHALAAAGAHAMIDLSDGVAGDAQHIAEASGADLTIDLERVPLDAGVAEVAAALDRNPVQYVVTGGDDYELLVCVAEAQRTQAELAAQPAGLSWIGYVQEARPGEGPRLRLVKAGQEVVGLRGYEHFAGS